LFLHFQTQLYFWLVAGFNVEFLFSSAQFLVVHPGIGLVQLIMARIENVP